MSFWAEQILLAIDPDKLTEGHIIIVDDILKRRDIDTEVLKVRLFVEEILRENSGGLKCKE